MTVMEGSRIGIELIKVSMVCEGTPSIEGFRNFKSLGRVVKTVACRAVCAVVSVRVSVPELTFI